MSGQRFATVQTLRGIASLSVCWYHVVTSGGLDLGSALFTAEHGFLGVQLFFVISGFVLPYSMWAGEYTPERYLRFVAKRLVRLDPPYFVSVVLCIVATYLSARYYHGRPFPLSTNSVLLHLGYLNAFVDNKWVNPVYWTLAIEFQYYLAIGLAFSLVRSSDRRWFWCFILGCVVSQYLIPQGTYLPHHWPWFLIGMIVFRVKVRLMSTPEAIFMIGGIALWGAAVVGIPAALAGVLGAVAILFTNFATRWTDWLGDISYSLYLLHFPIGVRLGHYLQPQATTPERALIVALLATAVSGVSAWILYRTVELPSQRWASRIRYA